MQKLAARAQRENVRQSRGEIKIRMKIKIKITRVIGGGVLNHNLSPDPNLIYPTQFRYTNSFAFSSVWQKSTKVAPSTGSMPAADFAGSARGWSSYRRSRIISRCRSKNFCAISFSVGSGGRDNARRKAVSICASRFA